MEKSIGELEIKIKKILPETRIKRQEIYNQKNCLGHSICLLRNYRKKEKK